MPTTSDPETPAGWLGDGQRAPEADRPTRRSRRRKVLLGLLAGVLVLVLLAGGTLVYLQHRLSSQLHRIPDAFSGLTHRPARPAGVAGTAMNVLVIGSDRRSAQQTTGSRAGAQEWVPGAQRSDTLMVVHVSGDRQSVSVVSIPRDSWVPIPGHGTQKINAAFSYAGPSLAIQTVENLTGLRIDHLAVVDWDGFKDLTNLLGGATVVVPKTVYDSARNYTWTAGEHVLDGKQALLYVRQRHGLPGGDFDRIQRQQNLIRALLHKVHLMGYLSSPVKVYRLLDAVTANLSVDSGWSLNQMRVLAQSMSSIPNASYYYTTAPVAGTGRVGAADVVFLDKGAGRTLWSALRSDQGPAWFAQHPTSRLPGTYSVK